MGVCGACKEPATRVIEEMVDLNRAWQEISADEVAEFDLLPCEGDPYEVGEAPTIPTGQQRCGCDKHAPPPFRPMLMEDTVREMQRLLKQGRLTARKIKELREAQ